LIPLFLGFLLTHFAIIIIGIVLHLESLETNRDHDTLYQ
jgi:hypothetical protein